MKIAFGLACAVATALLAGGAPGEAEARTRGWSRPCACAPQPRVRRAAHRRVRRFQSSYRPVLAVDSVPIVVETGYGPIAVGQRRTVGYFFPHPRWGYDYPWDGYGGPYYGYPPRDRY